MSAFGTRTFVLAILRERANPAREGSERVTGIGCVTVKVHCRGKVEKIVRSRASPAVIPCPPDPPRPTIAARSKR